MIRTTKTSSGKMTRRFAKHYFFFAREVSFEMSLDLQVKILTNRATDKRCRDKTYLICLENTKLYSLVRRWAVGSEFSKNHISGIELIDISTAMPVVYSWCQWSWHLTDLIYQLLASPCKSTCLSVALFGKNNSTWEKHKITLMFDTRS